MNIHTVETYPLLYRLREPYGDANGYKKYRSTFLIHIITDSGLDGWGECCDWLPGVTVGFRDRIIPYLVGKSAWSRAELARTVGIWHQRSAVAVSMALTEIAAKSAGVHLCEYWGGRLRSHVPVYASMQSYSEAMDWAARSVRMAEAAAAENFKAIKVKIGGRSYPLDKQHIVALQASSGGKLDLILDANQSYDVAATRRWCSLLGCWGNVLWLEEPMPFQMVEEYRLLRRILPVPIAGGENMKGTADFVPLLNGSALDILQPDPMHHPDIDSYRESLSIARQYGYRVSPHCYDGGLARLYALSAQACLAPWSKMGGEGVEPIEWDYMDNPFTRLFPIQLDDGAANIPTGPGLGIAPDMDLIRSHLWDGGVYW